MKNVSSMLDSFSKKNISVYTICKIQQKVKDLDSPLIFSSIEDGIEKLISDKINQNYVYISVLSSKNRWETHWDLWTQKR